MIRLLPTRSLTSRFAGPALIFLAAFIAIVPEVFRGASCGHDFDVHLVSWFDCLNAWRHGIFYPHWAPSPNYGAGEPRFVFYPPLTWMIGAALATILPWTAVPIALTFITFAATGLATRALARLALTDAQSTLAGCVAIFSGYAIFTGYERTAFPEFAGGFWLPLLMLYALRENWVPQVPRTRGPGKDAEPAVELPRSLFRSAFNGSTVPLAIALAGAWLSNLPLGVIAAYLLATLALCAAIASGSWAPIMRATAGGLLGLGLAAIYWLPAALERNWVDVRQATQDPGYNFENNWLFIRHADPNARASRRHQSPGLVDRGHHVHGNHRRAAHCMASRHPVFTHRLIPMVRPARRHTLLGRFPVPARLTYCLARAA